MGTPMIQNKGYNDKIMKRKRDYPLPDDKPVLELVGLTVIVNKMCRRLRLRYEQVLLLFLLANNGFMGVSVTWLCNNVYGKDSGRDIKNMYMRLKRLDRLGYVENVNRRYRLSLLGWEVLGRGLEQESDKG